MSKADLDQFVSQFGKEVILSTHHHQGDETAMIVASQLIPAMRFLKNQMGYDFLVDITAVDYWGRAEARFEVVYHLRSMRTGARLRIKVPLMEPEDGQAPSIESIVPLWPAANWLEREVWDLYGIQFMGHPDLRRILLYEEFVGYPLRKDYPKEKRQPLVRRENLLPANEDPRGTVE